MADSIQGTDSLARPNFPHDWLDWDEYYKVHLSYMRTLERKQFVIAATLSFEHIKNEHGDLVLVHVYGLSSAPTTSSSMSTNGSTRMALPFEGLTTPTMPTSSEMTLTAVPSCATTMHMARSTVTSSTLRLATGQRQSWRAMSSPLSIG